MTVGVFPASFDPITCGHVDLASRASELVDRLVVAVYSRPRKNVLFSLEERVAMVREALADLPNVDVQTYEGLTVELCRRVGAKVLFRGLRTVADFESEYQQATLNRRMLPGLEVVCMFAAPEYSVLSSSMIKEIAENGGDVSGMVPAAVQERLSLRAVAAPHHREVSSSTF